VTPRAGKAVACIDDIDFFKKQTKNRSAQLRTD